MSDGSTNHWNIQSYFLNCCFHNWCKFIWCFLDHWHIPWFMFPFFLALFCYEKHWKENVQKRTACPISKYCATIKCEGREGIWKNCMSIVNFANNTPTGSCKILNDHCTYEGGKPFCNICDTNFCNNEAFWMMDDEEEIIKDDEDRMESISCWLVTFIQWCIYN